MKIEKIEKTEGVLLGSLLVLLLLALVGPSLAQPAHYHDFADQRAWGFLPCALDVLSNLPFALWGAVGLACLFRTGSTRACISASQWNLATLFFVGLILTAAASAWYHWQPDDAGLVIDRLGMVVAFAGLLGLAASDRVSSRAGMWLALVVLALGPLSVAAWAASGNVLPWVVLQFGGIALLLWLACMRSLPDTLAVRWGLVIAVYLVAKVLEQADEAVYALTSELVSGHSLKHVVASCAAWPVVSAIRRLRKQAEYGSASRRGEHAGSRRSRRTTTA